MKTIMLAVGKKGGRTAKVPLRVAEDIGDINELAHSDPKAIVRMFNRGWRIENQERSGARDAIAEGKTDEEIAQLVAEYDPTVVKTRVGTSGGRKKKVKLDVPQGAQTLSLDALREALAAQGVTIEFAGAEG